MVHAVTIFLFFVLVFGLEIFEIQYALPSFADLKV